jgi:lipid-binding SYLF domain-containing protein
MRTNRIQVVLLALLIAAAGILGGCATPKGSTVMDKRAYAQNMRSDALLQLYQHAPDARREMAGAPGYAVFEAVQTQVLITSAGNAYGIVHDNQTGADTYMSAFSAGAGFGAGIKNFRAVVVFKDRDVMREFVDSGWVFGASGTADAKAGSEGASASTAMAFDDRLKVYTFTDSGLMAGASLRGVKVWKNEELN